MSKRGFWYWWDRLFDNKRWSFKRPCGTWSAPCSYYVAYHMALGDSNVIRYDSRARAVDPVVEEIVDGN